MRAVGWLLLLLLLLPLPALAAADGHKLFSDNCASCHGASGRGDGPNAAKLSRHPTDLVASRDSLEKISSVVRDGQRGCPSWKGSLDEEKIAAVAAYARSLQK